VRRELVPDPLEGARRTLCAFEEHTQNGVRREPVHDPLEGARRTLCACKTPFSNVAEHAQNGAWRGGASVTFALKAGPETGPFLIRLVEPYADQVCHPFRAAVSNDSTQFAQPSPHLHLGADGDGFWDGDAKSGKRPVFQQSGPRDWKAEFVFAQDGYPANRGFPGLCALPGHNSDIGHTSR
jgi:hypothetical protein